MSQSAKPTTNAQKDASSRYLEALTHAEKLVETQPSEEDKSAWRKWARELVNYEAQTLAPREKRAPRLAKYSDGAGERFLTIMKTIEGIEKKLKEGGGSPSSSGESEPEEGAPSPRRSTRRVVEVVEPDSQATDKEPRQGAESPRKITPTPNLTDAARTVNHSVPCARCARAGIACAGKEGRACFTCRAHRQGCELSSRAVRERSQTGNGTDVVVNDKESGEKEAEGSASTAGTSNLTKSTKSKEKVSPAKADAKGSEKEKEKEKEASEPENRSVRPRRATTLVANPRSGAPKTVAQLRANTTLPNLSVGSPSKTKDTNTTSARKRRATDADLSVASSAPPGPSPSKRAKKVDVATRPARRAPTPEDRSRDVEVDREEIADALLVCEAAFRQLRKALRV